MNTFFIYNSSDYQNIFFAIKRVTLEPSKEIILNFKLQNDIATKDIRFLLEFFNYLEDYQFNKNGKVEINWYYSPDNEDLAETGREFAEDVKLKFNLIPC
jgi:hypothetical protein